jgi:hypothetical protein
LKSIGGSTRASAASSKEKKNKAIQHKRKINRALQAKKMNIEKTAIVKVKKTQVRDRDLRAKARTQNKC